MWLRMTIRMHAQVGGSENCVKNALVVNVDSRQGEQTVPRAPWILEALAEVTDQRTDLDNVLACCDMRIYTCTRLRRLHMASIERV